MQKIKTFIVWGCLCVATSLFANQGMWIPPALPDSLFDYLDEAGSDLIAQDIYSEQDTSLKDQVVYLSNGHSGVLLSSQGLLLTNYTPFIPFISNTDSLSNGFTALSPLQEIPLQNLYALQLKRTQNITKQITDHLPDTPFEDSLQVAVDSLCQEIYLEQPRKPGHIIQIEHTSNNQYYLYEYARYDDVRLVYLPQNSLAISPWQSPWQPNRYAADFCLLRLYTSRDNTPVAYTEFNMPAQQLPHAVISQITKRTNDPVFYLGYPNFSERYLLADQLEERLADDSAKVQVWQFLEQQYQAKTQAKQDSVWQQHTIIKNLKLVEDKHKQEWDFTYWAANHPDFQSALRYGNLLPLLHNSYAIRKHHLKQYRILSTLFGHVNSVQMGMLFLDMNSQNERAILQQISLLFGQLNMQTEPAWLASALDYYKTVCDTTYMPSFYATIAKKYKGDTQKYVNNVLKKSFITDEKRFTKYLDNPTQKQRNADPLLQLCNELKQIQRLHYLLYAQSDKQVKRAKRMHQTGLHLQDSTLNALPDANYTMRLGYGTIQGYSAGNGMEINAFATLNQRGKQSYLQNEITALDSTLTQALQNDTIITDFFTTCDAPHGRMGHAVYNAQGELLGIMSGTNPEGKYNTYVYNAHYQRTQVSSMDYLVFLLEQGPGSYLVDELTFGEPEQLVQIQYVTPSPIPFVFMPDSIQVNDSTWVVLTDSLLQDSAFVTQYDSVLRRLSLLKDSTLLRLGTIDSVPEPIEGFKAIKDSIHP
ncbi:MAG: S46 family peptidase [Paludibacteraceae bacterium]|nr:S46 family peptidase [Paludibacteraceae bacterium]